jgi:hypothetical protein
MGLSEAAGAGLDGSPGAGDPVRLAAERAGLRETAVLEAIGEL